MMRRAVQTWGMGLLIIEVVACSSLRVPPPAHEGAHIGISLSAHALIFPEQITTIYFARLKEEQNDFISKLPLIPSNARVGTRFYLLNAPPGRYIAVAARGWNAAPGSGPAGSTGSVAGTGAGIEYYIAFSKPLVALTEVKADLGRLVFMGDFRVKTRVGLGVADADEVQVNTFMYFKAPVNLGSVEDVKQGVESGQEFLAKARGDLGESAWGTIIQESLAFPERK